MGVDFVQEVIAATEAIERLPPRGRRRHRARRRGRQDHLPPAGPRAADERHLRGRHRRLHRPDGHPAADGRRRPRRPRRPLHRTSTRSPPAAGCSPSPTCSRCSTRAPRTPTSRRPSSRPSPPRPSPAWPAGTRSAATSSSSAARCTSCPSCARPTSARWPARSTSLHHPAQRAALRRARAPRCSAARARAPPRHLGDALGDAPRRRSVPLASATPCVRCSPTTPSAPSSTRGTPARTVPQGDLASARRAAASSASTPARPPSRPSCSTPTTEIVFSHYAVQPGRPGHRGGRHRAPGPRDPAAGGAYLGPLLRHRLRRGPRPGRPARRRRRDRDDGPLPGRRARRPGVTSVIDIGGQDMKYLRIRNGAVDSIAVNEACSSGCGSFLQTFAETMGTDVRQLRRAPRWRRAARSTSARRCTVFMNSSVKQAQKEGADVGDISAGLSYSVVRNALYKVIKLQGRRPARREGRRPGRHLPQRRRAARLRAADRARGRPSRHRRADGRLRRRADRAARTGTPGAAHRAAWSSTSSTTSRSTTERDTCRLCQNHCQLTISTFGDGTRHVSGNRCERGASDGDGPAASPSCRTCTTTSTSASSATAGSPTRRRRRGDIGIPRVLNMYENYPLWFTMLTRSASG